MRLLIVSPFVPFPPDDGGRQRIFELARRLARRHAVGLVALGDPADPALEALREHGIDAEAVAGRGRGVRPGRSRYGARFDVPAMHAAVARRLADGPDLVQCDFSYMATYRPAAPACPWVLVEHNVEHRIVASLAAHRGGVYRAYAVREQRLRRREELAACAAADRVVCVSAADAALLRAEVRTPIDVVPNGVDLERVQPLPDTGTGAVFVGKMDYGPNADGVRWFAQDVLPRVRAALPGFPFTVVGAHPPALPGVHATGRVDDVLPFLRDAALSVVPLRAGSGTRLKILESMAAGRPVVSTRAGAEGLEAGDALVLADGAAAFAAAVVRLAGDPAERARLAAAGRALVEARFGWDALAAELERCYAEVACPA